MRIRRNFSADAQGLEIARLIDETYDDPVPPREPGEYDASWRNVCLTSAAGVNEARSNLHP